MDLWAAAIAMASGTTARATSPTCACSRADGRPGTPVTVVNLRDVPGTETRAMVSLSPGDVVVEGDAEGAVGVWTGLTAILRLIA